MKKLWIALGLSLGVAPAAWADNVAHCEILLTQVIASEDGSGEAQIASYRPAVNFLASLYDEDTDSHLSEVDNSPIRGVLCRRNNVIPASTDYNILATGIPFILSQNFDSAESDSLTVYWKQDEGAFNYVYKGHPLSDDGQSLLDTRLAEFSARGLLNSEDTPETDAASDIDWAADVSETEFKTSAQIEAELDAEIAELTRLNVEPETKTEFKTNAQIEAELDAEIEALTLLNNGIEE